MGGDVKGRITLKRSRRKGKCVVSGIPNEVITGRKRKVVSNTK